MPDIEAVALIGAITALILIPITPAGIPVIAAASAIIWVRPACKRR